MKSLTENAADWDLLLDEQTNLWQAGERPDVGALLVRSGLSHNQDALLDLLYNEIVLRETAGETPTMEEYIGKYPLLVSALTAQFEVHRALGSGALVETEDRQHDLSSPNESDLARQEMPPQLPNYEIIREIGRGGSGAVYQAHHKILHRDVALKMFHPERNPSPRELLRFASEATAVARLSHPHIVQIFEIGEWGGAPFLALEFAEGGTLAQKLQKTLMTPTMAADLVEQLALAVQHAHDRQVIHRDLKPANVLFARDGSPKIADFGLAKILTEDLEIKRDFTRTGEPLGTPRYMSPEQASGRKDIGPQTDIYALGTLLYECLTGQAPFIATSVVETLQKICHDEPRSPNRLQPGVPRDLVTICLHCLHKEPERRYPSAMALANDLARFRTGKTITARPTPRWERAVKWCRRRPAEASLIALGIFLVIAFFAVQLSSEYQERQRIDGLRSEVSTLMQDGQEAIEANDLDAAQHHFAKAWRIVQVEPAISDHVSGVAGWLDHSQRAASIQLWQGRLPPREFDERRDLAIVESLLLEPRPPESIKLARASLHAARELTLPDDPTWQSERERLALLEAELIAYDLGDVAALDFLNSAGEFSSRLYCERKHDLLQRMNDPAASQLHTQSLRFPPDRVGVDLMEGISKVRQREFAAANLLFEKILNAQPAHFPARLLQSICFVHLDRLNEAKVALTACIAQRPTFPWSYYWRAVAYRAEGDIPAANIDIRRAVDLKPSATLQFVLDQWTDSSEHPSKNLGANDGE